MLEQASSINLDLSARSIAAIQSSSGAIPWGPGRHWDPWNHVEAAMGLTAAGLYAEATTAYICLTDTQRADGSWSAAYLGDEVMDPTIDANFCAYVAVGVRHHFLTTGDPLFLEMMWPVVRRAVDRVLTMQRADGSIAWAEDGSGALWDGALVSSSACIFLSLTSALELARLVGHPSPEWEIGRLRLRESLVNGVSFEDKASFAMDWYYPVLSGALSGDDAVLRLSGRWDRFVIPARGARCTDDRPWVTAGETSELILACLRNGMRKEADSLFTWVQHLRDDADGLYWTGANHPTGDLYPYEKTTWSAASVLLAADALAGGSATCEVFGIDPSS